MIFEEAHRLLRKFGHRKVADVSPSQVADVHQASALRHGLEWEKVNMGFDLQSVREYVASLGGRDSPTALFASYASALQVVAACVIDIIEAAIDAPSEDVVEQSRGTRTNDLERAPMLNNYFFSALAGTTWYMQFFFYTMGETQMGKYGFASWTLHMASIIIFSTMWGWIFHEWKGSSKKAHSLIASGIAMLILSTIIIGVGTWLKSQTAAQ